MRKIFIWLITCFLLVGLMSGCGKKMTAEELLTDMAENYKQVKSMEGDRLETLYINRL